jgi:hypothetical protein
VTWDQQFTPNTNQIDNVVFNRTSQDFGSFLISVETDPSVHCEGDANGDGEVTFADITNVLGNWLAICP